MVFNAAINNILGRPVLLVDETGVSGENRRPTIGKSLANFIT